MHVARADLDLEQLPTRAEHRRVQRLVAVRLGLRDVVLDALLHRRPAVVDDAERVVALEDVRHDHADGEQVVDVLVRPVALLHLLVDRPQVLRPAGDFDVGDAGVGQPLLERLAHLRDQRLALAALGRDQLRERLVRLGLEVLEGEILELPPHLRHAEAMRERRVQVARLLRDAPPLLGREPVERAHVVQAVGELDQDDARILGDRQQQLAVVLDLPFLARGQRQVGDLGQPVDDLRDFLAELALDIRRS